jgi:hypothetical protein
MYYCYLCELHHFHKSCLICGNSDSCAGWLTDNKQLKENTELNESS